MATYNQLSIGSRGSDVTELQKLLNQNGFTLDEDGIFGEKTQAAVRQYQQKNGLDVDGIVGNNTWGALRGAGNSSGAASSGSGAKDTGFNYSPYQESDAVTQAQALLQQQQAQKPGAYQSQWNAQIEGILDQILNREKFSYDVNADALYQQYKDQYVTQGRMAMMDTMGMAAGMTGGYGNSYAQSVGQQAYQGYLQQLNDKIPELYQLALSQYQMEGDQLLDQYAILGAQEEQDYGRYRDQMADWQSERDRLQDIYYTERDYDYGKWADGRDFGYGQYIDDRNYQYQVGRDQVADEQWQKEYDEAIRQFNYANGLGEFAPAAGSGGGGGTVLNIYDKDGNVDFNKIKQNSDWWKKFAAENGFDVKTGKKLSTGGNNNNNGGTGIGKGTFSNWQYSDWESYFAHIRQDEGQAAAEQELKLFTENGYIPDGYVAAASLGVRGGKMGH